MSMKTSRFLLLPIFLIPFPAAAAVQVTEIMYDLPGSDSGREWVEVQNAGSSSVDLATYKFFNKDGGHLLKVYGSGTTVVPVNGIAVIADKPDLFLVDNPSYTGILIDSSFSLVTADTVGIKDADNTIIDSIAYASSMGANGDGNTLQRSGSSLIAAAPTPGSVVSSGSASSGSSSSTSSDTSSSSSGSTAATSSSDTSSSSNTVPLLHTKQISVDGGGDRTVIAGADALFSAKAYGTAGEPLTNAAITWNFGNGESREGRTVSFAYPYPGKYVLSVMAVSGEYAAEDRVLIEVVPAEVALTLETDGSISVLNKSKRDLDISLWRLTRGSQTFYIPKNTVVLANEHVRFATSTTKFTDAGTPGLSYPNGTSAVAGAEPSVAETTTRDVVQEIAEPVPQIKTVSAKRPSSKSQPAAAIAAFTQDALATSTHASSASDAWMLWFAAALGIGTLGAAGVVFMRHGLPTEQMVQSASDREAEEYDILE